MNISHRSETEPKKGLRYAITWFLFSFLLPGVGLIANKQKISGTIVITMWVAFISLSTVLFISGEWRNLLFEITSSPTRLMILTFVIPITGLFYVTILIITALRLGIVRINNRVKRIIFIILASTVSLALLAPVGLATAYTYQTREVLLHVFAEESLNELQEAPQPLTQADLWAGQGRVNILLLGSDAGSDRVGIRPDIIMIASVDPQTGNATLFSLPRNLSYVPFPDSSPLSEVFPSGFSDLINAVWTWAESHPEYYPNDPQPGLTATKEAVEGATGLPIDYSAVVNMQGFVDLVNAVGGVTINVPRTIPIGETGEEPTGYVEAGEQRHLDGFEALWFVRSRADSDDYDRMERTKCMVQTLTNTIKPDTLLMSYTQILAAIQNNFYTDIPQSELRKWVDLLDRIQNGSLSAVAFTNSIIAPGDPDYAYIHQIVQEHLTAVVVVEEAPPGEKPKNLLEKIGTRNEDKIQQPLGEYC